jgi:predicted AlkP superfamily pyrophosphatase or phosphodiesterase
MTNTVINTPRPGSPREIAVPARHLVFIGLDGWGGDYVSKADMPTVKRMIAGGASSLDTRCVKPSISWPNWTSLFFATPPEYRTSEQFPSIFMVVKNSGRENTPVLFYDWLDLYGICSDETADKLEINSDLESAQKIAAYFLEKKPLFTAIVFNEPDHTGHKKRWGSRAYYSKLAELDGYITIIEQAVKDAGVYDDTVFVLSADHGGSGWDHWSNIPQNRKIPLIVFGKGIKEGYAIPSPLSICDIAPTMAAILGLEVPPEWTGHILTDIF